MATRPYQPVALRLRTQKDPETLHPPKLLESFNQ
jgi:hypothetical protein